ncbi:MAG: type I DNA topoisomerase [Holosporales bacterium]|jgi:DNA topoisomerase-1|nr:type I DNA topoisomerase [Holosporales bacterium]
MKKGVVVVESPAKAKTLSSFLGNDYKVIASYGHIRDLPPKDGSVDTENHYSMKWEMSERGKKQLKEIVAELSKTDQLYLATDPDREGEAISWHILEALKEKKKLKGVNIKRVVFHEITKTAIEHAFKQTKDLDINMVDAYLARRALDYLVGFSLSPILWRKMPGARSAGRVQSVALRIIVERELEIQAFNSEEYWSIHGDFYAQNGDIFTNLTHFEGKKLEKLDIKSETEASTIKKVVEQKNYKIGKIEKKSVKKSPSAPFTTATFQQEAIRKLGLSAKNAMQIAQKLYEGIQIDGTMVGLITYMRTDSTALSADAVSESRSFVESEYGKNYLPKSPRVYKTKTKNAQEAHEAIRPTSFIRTPSKMQTFLPNSEFKVYELIWKRALASQMENAILDQVSIEVTSTDKSETKFRATGSTIGFDGFLKIYTESADEGTESEKTIGDAKKLPVLYEGEELNLKKINCNQHFTEPPARFNEASLVKKLEELGIGRPSTYATIINVLQERKYTTLNKRVFFPENMGFMTTSFLRNFFTKYVQYDFTADLEEDLDDISNGKARWEKILDRFWDEFGKHIKNASELSITKVIDVVEKDIENYVFKDLKNGKKCPVCSNGEIRLKFGKFGAFLGCSAYPECRFTQKINNNGEMENSAIPTTNEVIGIDERYKGDKVFLKKGPYGYYFEWEKTKDEKNKKKPKRVGIPKKICSNPTSLTLKDAIKFDQLPLELGEGISLHLGKFGPFIKHGNKTYKIPSDVDFFEIDLEQAKKMMT